MGNSAIFLAVVIGGSLLMAGLGVAVTQKQPRDVADAPARLTSSGRIAPAGEPGTPLVISGTVVAADGKTLLAGVVVYAYHTDAEGYYRRVGASGEEAGEREPRLRGWVKTGADGRFEFSTIKPAPYPHHDGPAHVHIHAWGAGYPRQWFMLEFAGDPLLPKQHFTDSTADYLYVAPLTRDSQGVWHCSFTMRLLENTNFREGS
jgi:protocatechuate 3,4-dioxygenase beta subunit